MLKMSVFPYIYGMMDDSPFEHIPADGGSIARE
jgi:hypothetical protein